MPIDKWACSANGLIDFQSQLIYPQFMLKRPVQLEFRTQGGRRKGAGRPAGNRVSHHPRPAFERITASLITLKLKNHVPSLRSSRRFAVVRQVFAAARGQNGLRLVEFSVQGNHLHFIVEADNKTSLSRGMQGLNVRIARALNRLLRRTGTLFADHYHSRLLHSPTELCAAIRYVLGNAEHHFGEPGVDRFSSAAPEGAAVRSDPLGWLLRAGWRLGRWPRGGPPGGSRYC
jgi:REP element-mobilizing transposase RayT